MATLIYKDVKCWMDGYDISGRLNKLGLEYAAELPDATTFGVTTRTRRPGLKIMKATLDGYADFDDEGVDEQVFSRLAVANTAFSFSPDGGDEGEAAHFFRAVVGQYKQGGSIGDMYAFGAVAEGSDGSGPIRGTVMHNATRSTSASGTARELGAVSATQKLYAALHVLSVSAGDTLDVIVESDALETFLSPATKITFSQASAISAQFATPVAGAITDGWWRISWTVGGAAVSIAFVVVVGIL